MSFTYVAGWQNNIMKVSVVDDGEGSDWLHKNKAFTPTHSHDVETLTWNTAM